MSYDYSKMQTTANRLIQKFGTTVTVTRKNAVENPVTGVSDAAADTEGTFNGVAVASSGSDFDTKISGLAAEIGMSARFFVLAALDTSFQPAGTDIITMDSTSMSILGCTPVDPAGSGSEIVYRVGAAV